MKNLYAAIFLATFLYACSDQPKTTTVKYTDTAVRDTFSAKAGNALKNDSVARLLTSLAANDSILPGKSIGNIILEENTEEVIQALGRPDSTKAGKGSSVLSWYSNLPGKAADSTENSIKIVTKIISGKQEETNRVKQMRVTSSFFKTAGQAGVGSTIVFIKMQFPSLKKATGSYTAQNGGNVTVYDAVKEGIAFEIGGLTKCIGITVHKPGEKVSPLWDQ
ncbi:MAG: hypothetical protein WKF88_07740 [Ferruginibacter sp.]